MSRDNKTRRSVIKSLGTLGVGGAVLGSGASVVQEAEAGPFYDSRSHTFDYVGEEWKDSKSVTEQTTNVYGEQITAAYEFTVGVKCNRLNRNGNFEFVVSLHTAGKAVDENDDGYSVLERVAHSVGVPEADSNRYYFPDNEDTVAMYAPDTSANDDINWASDYGPVLVSYGVDQLQSTIGTGVDLLVNTANLLADIGEVTDDYDQNSMDISFYGSREKEEIHAYREFEIVLDDNQSTTFTYNSFAGGITNSYPEINREYTIHCDTRRDYGDCLTCY